MESKEKSITKRQKEISKNMTKHNTLLINPQVQGKVSKETLINIELNENENTTYQNTWNSINSTKVGNL